MKLKEDFVTIALIFILILSVGMLAFSLKDFFGSKPEVNQVSNQMKSTSRMSLTGFDRELARQLMDKNNDGLCDVCGMPIEQCIDSGQIECNMGSSAKVGVLGSQHIHADWKVYVNGKEFDWSPYADRHERQMAGDPSVKDTSAFIHIHPAPAPEKGGDVLHMHATGVPLQMLFKSIGMDFNKECITLGNDGKFCNDGDKSLKFFVNGKENKEFENYVFKNLDKILISYGSETQEEIKNQLDSITDFAKSH